MASHNYRQPRSIYLVLIRLPAITMTAQPTPRGPRTHEGETAMTNQMERLTTVADTPAPTRQRNDLSDLVDNLVVGIDASWMHRAACKGRPELFFGIAGERPERRVRRETAARKVCESCPVIEPCRQAARLNRESGFWGGESEEDRAAAGYTPRSVSRRSVQAAASQAMASPQAAAS